MWEATFYLQRVSSGARGSCQTLGSLPGNVPRQQLQPDGPLSRAFFGEPSQSMQWFS